MDILGYIIPAICHGVQITNIHYFPYSYGLECSSVMVRYSILTSCTSEPSVIPITSQADMQSVYEGCIVGA